MPRYDSAPIDAIRAAMKQYPLGWSTYNGFRMAVVDAADEAGADSLEHLLDILDSADEISGGVDAKISHARRLALHASLDPVTR